MNEFFSVGWSIWITAIALGGVVFCLFVLISQLKGQPKKGEAISDTGHSWDGITEYDTPLPRWWVSMYLILSAIALAYMFLYPALGSFDGFLGTNQAKEVRLAQEEIEARVQPVFQKYAEMPITDIAKDDEARAIGQRLFLNNCAQCHGSDAQGSPSFPNLSDDSWLWGGEPEQILHTITNGRRGIMPAHNAMMTPAQASEIAQYVRSLSNLAHDQTRVVPGKKLYDQFCVACHGAEGKGNQMLGAPNLTDSAWLYGSSEDTIVYGILNGRDNQMPAQKDHLSQEQIRLLAGWVWGLSNVEQ
ncbi:cytochrome-c oxidase, cbb3-type subunit III [Paenalcaligenes hominis]|uniref:Cbb3-type cytochrome c oxidase subunit n=1 Tax=Paenalcaligenes hominis TaxID=643674 RepID=A0A1U9JYY2_9BURK|nr:cytochrome-c oxidase, cbb3-type subunit III [Paenalcaligenes hominis]AQS50992.1 cytochrome-c oxidase, cbb3-type subunit III [Paenalcaligenes hominis]